MFINVIHVTTISCGFILTLLFLSTHIHVQSLHMRDVRDVLLL